MTVLGLPAHPLLVHAVVVLLPLAALGAFAVAARPRWNRSYAPLVAAAALVAAVTATLAQQAGNQLADALTVGAEVEAQISEHGRYGLYVIVASWPFAALTVATALAGRRGSGRLPRVVAVLAAVAGMVALAVTLLAGHSGSSAVWGFVDL